LLFAAAGLAPRLTAAQTATTDAGLRIEGIMAEYTVQPGQVLTHQMRVSLGKDAQAPLDVLVDARGLGQGLDGATLALEPADDSSPYSARTFISNIDHTSFHLEPGSVQAVTATIEVPSTVTAGMRYADIYLHTLPSGSGRVGVVLAAHVTVILTVGGAEFTQTGKISKLDVLPVESGKPIQVTTVVQNTGNRHYRANALIAITDTSGKEVAQVLVPQSGSSILPGFPRAYTASFPLLNKLEGLATGMYGADSKIVLEDGQLIDERKTTFQITAPYEPFPDLDPSTRVVVTYNDEEPAPIDARLQADLRVVFSNTGKVSGTVVLGRFKNAPAGAPSIADPLGDGGLGKPGLKYWGVAVQGFSRGSAEVTGFYRDQELNGVQPNSVLLVRRVSAATPWTKLDNLEVFPNAQNVRGELSVQLLNAGAPIGLAGDPHTPTLLDAIVSSWIVGVMLGVLVLALIGGLAVVRRRGRSQPV